MAALDEAGQLDRRRRSAERSFDHRTGQQNSTVVAPSTTGGNQ